MPMKSYHRPILSALSFLLGSSAAIGGESDARGLAAHLRKMMLQFEGAVSAKADAERKFYIEQQKVLRDHWLPGEIPASESDEKAKGALAKKIQESVPYLAVEVEAFRTAHELAESIATDPGNATTKGSLYQYLDEGVRKDLANVSMAQKRQQLLRTELGPSLAELDLQDARRKAIRDSVQVLETAPSPAERLRQVFEIGQAAAKQIKSGK